LDLQETVEEGRNVMRITAWSLLDNFKWQMGYKIWLGLVFCRFFERPEASSQGDRRMVSHGRRNQQSGLDFGKD